MNKVNTCILLYTYIALAEPDKLIVVITANTKYNDIHIIMVKLYKLLWNILQAQPWCYFR